MTTSNNLNEQEYIEWLQRYILVHSWIYYEGSDSLITDQQYDKKARELVELQSRFQDITQTQYGYVFHDFDGTTGFDLYHRLNENDKKYIVQIACHVTRLANREFKEQGHK